MVVVFGEGERVARAAEVMRSVSVSVSVSSVEEEEEGEKM